MFSHSDLNKRVHIVFGSGVHSVAGTLTDYDDVNGRWIEVQGIITSIDRRTTTPSRHLIPADGISYIRFDKEEEKP